MPAKQRFKILRIITGHRRLFLCVGLALAVFAALTGHAQLPTRILIAWDASVLLYLGFAFSTFANFDVKEVRLRAAQEDEGAVLLLFGTMGAAVASLGAILALLGSAKGRSDGHSIYPVFAVGTIMLSWAFIHTVFALHYAHEFYGTGHDRKLGGLRFPAEAQPDYWDFVYFSFVVGMTFQVSDVQVTGRRFRHLVVLHGIISFVFSVAILALAVNIGSSFI